MSTKNADYGKVSIIVPAYNVARYIEDCIHSLVNQTYQNIEIIIVDDGSTDDTVQKCEASLLQYKDKIKILKQHNQGVGAARNKGLEHATGEYIAFVDGDDMLASSAIETHVQNLAQTDSDISIVSIYKFMDKPTNRHAYLSSPAAKYVKPPRVLSGHQVLTESCYDSKIGGGVANKMYKREAIDNTRFDHFAVAEDMLFNYLIFKKKNIKVVFSDELLYLYRIGHGTGSITHNLFDSRHWDGLAAECAVIEDAKDTLPEYAEQCHANLALYATKMLIKMIAGRHQLQKDYDKANQILKEEKSKFFSDHRRPFMKRAFVKLFISTGEWNAERAKRSILMRKICIYLNGRIG